MKVIDEYSANKMTENELRELALKKLKRKIPYSIGKKALVALLSGKLSEIEKQKVYKGIQPDVYGYSEAKRFTRTQLKKMIKDKYGFWFPDNVDISYMERIIEGRLKLNQLPQSVVYEIGKANPSLGSMVYKQFGWDKLPILKTLLRKKVAKKGKTLAKKIIDPRFAKSKYE